MAERGEIDRIRELLQQHPKGLTIEEVAQELGINRSTASKYLNSLVISGAATIRKLGPAKLFYLRELLPLHQLLNCTRDCLVVTDSDLVIQEINENALKFFKALPDQVKGYHALHTPVAPLFDQETCQVIENFPETGGGDLESVIRTDKGTCTVRKKIVPLLFQSGNPGAGIIFEAESINETGSGPIVSSEHVQETSLLRACKQSFQLSVLFRRFSQNQLSLAIDTLKRVRGTEDRERARELLQEETMILENLRFHLTLLEEYLANEVKVPGWYPLEDILNQALSSQKMAHIRFYSDVRGVEIYTDQDCGRIFFTLIENSIVHGKKVTSIRVTSREEEGDLTIIYEDDGIGIPDTEKITLFEWGHGIHRAHSLFLSRQMLAITDISIRETGTYGRGARFEIRVPSGRWRARRSL
ncbi:MAG: Histidine kinase-, DNA gyrase B-, and HSP90-like ATPase [Methanoregulaceae archaeon PtaU1.Bin059]|nr:MAG: Histidine kinase-, DNA gyrase B-, and HSP90-like ATPase [Methanoregulaceae archaeon PtaB.Bin152]OPY39542.1 MAG: Histidine kinase-, DNA gyrase B-, and HSP90-like ATPase [Methanoregulaceae archaeon PtaU1.Bin059]